MIAEAREISKVYSLGSTTVTALHPTSFSIASGEFLAILGPSGSGKSTLMNIIGLLDRPSVGQFYLNGVNCGGLSDDQAAQTRNRFVGFVFQAYHLLPRQTVLKNVELPLMYAGVTGSERKRRAIAALTAVKLSHRIDHLPSQLSGGEQQRTAIARAIVTDPPLILADEPTGALDTTTGWEILQLLMALNQAGRTIVMVTHDVQIAQQARRIISIRDGRIISDQPVTPRQAETAYQGTPHHEAA
ncbi:ABC transporter ATP-binding protein [Bradyrhizobium canariense]|uniref:Putative ABC transport system ATP-binding protein n=1 Tax=Bradyrhizobium canariense TaxID=255045 RepID=A0A1H1ZWD2_9BRAD|nr:ABC transporter ATP-binding protein [Bradyrhizobium canariense]SDT37963.1 putative ABC transport system ATP-binding protein [Bradyrhizobium canariense]